MKSSNRAPFALITLVALMPSLTFASDENPYSFGGSCPSQGAWTQAALTQAQNIANVIRQLKDNPKCKGLEKILSDLDTATTVLGTPKTEQVRENRLESLPSEIDALRRNVMEDGKPNNQSSSMLLHRTLEAAAISSELRPISGIQSVVGGTNAALSSFFTRYAEPTKKGLQLVTSVMQVIPQYDECLIGAPRQGLAIMSGLVKMAAAFSASGSGVGNELGNAIAGLMNMRHEREFTLALRKQDESEFWYSISCLLESATTNYCDAENAQEILQYSSQQYKQAMKSNLESRLNPSYDNPLEGYYLMVRELPAIQAWLQKVQFGATPRLSTDATFKNNIWTEVTTLTMTTNTLMGQFNEQKLFMKELADVKAKRNQLVQMIADVVTAIANSQGSKFFLTTVNQQQLPFYLIGMGNDNIPDAVLGLIPGKAPMDPYTWMRSSGKAGGFNELFTDPDALASVVENKLNDLMSAASDKSSTYFRSRLVVDMPNLVNETLTGQYMSVHKAFENVYNYLVRFEKHLNPNDPLDIGMIPSVRETRAKIGRFLKSYDALIALGRKMAVNTSADNEKLMGEIKNAANKVIGSAFDEFQMVLQKDTFLTTRLTTFIDKDFSMRVKSGLNMSQAQQDLLVITQKHLLEKLIEVHGVNPTDSQNDLAQAQTINRRNLQTIEDVFKDSMYRMILETKAMAEGKGESGVRRDLERKFREERKTLRQAAKYLPSTAGGGLLGWLMAGHAVRGEHPDLYGQSNGRGVRGMDDTQNSFATVRAKFCAQSLAFDDRGYFQDICQGAVLPSYYGNHSVKGLDLRYDDFMSSGTSKIRRNASLTAKNICAFNNYRIRNLVQWMKDQDAEMYQDSFSE